MLDLTLLFVYWFASSTSSSALHLLVHSLGLFVLQVSGPDLEGVIVNLLH